MNYLINSVRTVGQLYEKKNLARWKSDWNKRKPLKYQRKDRKRGLCENSILLKNLKKYIPLKISLYSFHMYLLYFINKNKES